MTKMWLLLENVCHHFWILLCSSLFFQSLQYQVMCRVWHVIPELGHFPAPTLNTVCQESPELAHCWVPTINAEWNVEPELSHWLVPTINLVWQVSPELVHCRVPMFNPVQHVKAKWAVVRLSQSIRMTC